MIYYIIYFIPIVTSSKSSKNLNPPHHWLIPTNQILPKKLIKSNTRLNQILIKPNNYSDQTHPRKHVKIKGTQGRNFLNKLNPLNFPVFTIPQKALKKYQDGKKLYSITCFVNHWSVHWQARLCETEFNKCKKKEKVKEAVLYKKDVAKKRNIIDAENSCP